LIGLRAVPGELCDLDWFVHGKKAWGLWDFSRLVESVSTLV